MVAIDAGPDVATLIYVYGPVGVILLGVLYAIVVKRLLVPAWLHNYIIEQKDKRIAQLERENTELWDLTISGTSIASDAVATTEAVKVIARGRRAT